MDKPYILITGYNTNRQVMTYSVVKIQGDHTQFLHQGRNKNGTYQVAHRIAKEFNLPLYEEVYRSFPDENGVEHFVAYKKREISLNHKEQTATA